MRVDALDRKLRDFLGDALSGGRSAAGGVLFALGLAQPSPAWVTGGS